MVHFAQAVLPSAEECALMMQPLAQGPQPAGALPAALPAARQALGFRGLLWLLKLGVVVAPATRQAMPQAV